MLPSFSSGRARDDDFDGRRYQAAGDDGREGGVDRDVARPLVLEDETGDAVGPDHRPPVLLAEGGNDLREVVEGLRLVVQRELLGREVGICADEDDGSGRSRKKEPVGSAPVEGRNQDGRVLACSLENAGVAALRGRGRDGLLLGWRRVIDAGDLVQIGGRLLYDRDRRVFKGLTEGAP